MREITKKYVLLSMYHKEDEAWKQIYDALNSTELAESVKIVVGYMFSFDIMKQTIMKLEIGTADQTPLGLLAKENLDNAEQLLELVEEDLKNGFPEDHENFSGNSKKFYLAIPQSSGKNPLPLINNQQIVDDKLQLLYELRNMEVTYNFINDKQKTILDYYQSLNTNIFPVDVESAEHLKIGEYANNTFASDHQEFAFKIEQIFKIDRNGEKERFREFEGNTNRMLLWHGSRVTNLPSILQNGLKVSPPSSAIISGKMFDQGIYFTDMVSKATRYTFRREEEDVALLLLCEVALGEMFEVTDKLARDFVKESLPEGKNSVKGKGKTYPSDNFDFEAGLKIPFGYQVYDDELESNLKFNEFVIYENARCKIKYLVQVRFTDDNE